MVSVLFLNVITALSSIVLFLVAALLYVTPKLGYDPFTGVIQLFSFILADTGPHFGFLISVGFGFLSLSLCMKDELSIGGNILILTTLVCLLGLINFDVNDHLKLHNTFVVGFSVAVSVFCLYALRWNTSDNNNNVFHVTGVILHCIVSGLLYCTTLYTFLKDNGDKSTITTSFYMNIHSCLQITWIMATLFMFGVYIFCK